MGRYHRRHLLYYTEHEGDSGIEQLDPQEIYAGKVVPVVSLHWLLAELEGRYLGVLWSDVSLIVSDFLRRNTLFSMH